LFIILEGGWHAMARELTQQQENFCKAYLKYGIGYKAYLEAYPNSKNWKRNSVDVEATKMLNSPKISHRINELNNEIESTLKTSTTLNKRKILEEIIELQQKCKLQDSQNTVNLQALKLLSQIAGLLQEQKTEINITNNTCVNEVTGYLDL
jgi:hypothetical protein